MYFYMFVVLIGLLSTFVIIKMFQTVRETEQAIREFQIHVRDLEIISEQLGMPKEEERQW